MAAAKGVGPTIGLQLGPEDPEPGACAFELRLRFTEWTPQERRGR